MQKTYNLEDISPQKITWIWKARNVKKENAWPLSEKKIGVCALASSHSYTAIPMYFVCHLCHFKWVYLGNTSIKWYLGCCNVYYLWQLQLCNFNFSLKFLNTFQKKKEMGSKTKINQDCLRGICEYSVAMLTKIKNVRFTMCSSL